jgi:hypothetical protein
MKGQDRKMAENKTAMIKARVTEQELATVESMAELSDMKMSAYTRLMTVHSAHAMLDIINIAQYANNYEPEEMTAEEAASFVGTTEHFRTIKNYRDDDAIKNAYANMFSEDLETRLEGWKYYVNNMNHVGYEPELIVDLAKAFRDWNDRYLSNEEN